MAEERTDWQRGILDLADRRAAVIAAERRPPTAAEAWEQRLLRARAELPLEEDMQVFHLLSEITRAEYLSSPETKLDLIGEHGHKTWQANPRRGDREWCRRRQGELWAEIGKLLGIGPPPWA
jgi:hypothetical protein